MDNKLLAGAAQVDIIAEGFTISFRLSACRAVQHRNQ